MGLTIPTMVIYHTNDELGLIEQTISSLLKFKVKAASNTKSPEYNFSNFLIFNHSEYHSFNTMNTHTKLY